jgi:multisubunit Na+/H+ antiporter MnhB subunit
MNRAYAVFVFLLVAAWLAVVAHAVAALPAEPRGLFALVGERLTETGVTHPVTGVLLNFRAYDTLLELLVLLLALMAAWSLALRPPESGGLAPGMVMNGLVGRLAPLAVLIGGYLLWLGSTRPGGAFQAGAVLGAGGVLLILSDQGKRFGLSLGRVRVLAAFGTAFFTSVGLAVLIGGRMFLEYPPEWAKSLILLIEGAAAVSIAVGLGALFYGGEPDGERGGKT